MFQTVKLVNPLEIIVNVDDACLNSSSQVFVRFPSDKSLRTSDVIKTTPSCNSSVVFLLQGASANLKRSVH